ncbi:MAG TPA: response regulator [Polyangia bacterium]|jgi:chemosensory pili system protein ChpA (sensor histidine kinase/response regulator)
MTPLVLMVDDDADVLAIGRHALEAHGYRVMCCFGAEEALEGMAEERPDLVVTDLMMHELDAGFALARRMRADARLAHVPVIVMTGVASQLGFDFRPRGAADLAAMGVAAFLEKPVKAEVLVARVGEVLAARQ